MITVQQIEPHEISQAWLIWYFQIPDLTYEDTLLAVSMLERTYQNRYHIELEAEILDQSSASFQHCIEIRLNREDSDIELNFVSIEKLLGFSLKPMGAE